MNIASLTGKYFILTDPHQQRILTGKIVGPIAHEWAGHYLIDVYPAALDCPTIADTPVIQNQSVTTLDMLQFAQIYDDRELFVEEIRIMRVRLKQIEAEQAARKQAALTRQVARQAAGAGRSRQGSSSDGGNDNPPPPGVHIINVSELAEYLGRQGDPGEPDATDESEDPPV